MKKLFIILCCIFLSVSLSAQNEINKTLQLFDYYCKQGLFTNASNLLVEKGNAYLYKGDTLTAYKLQLKNCQFTDEHLEEFLNSGLTWEGYFANWYVTISLEGWLNKKEDGARHLYTIIRKMKNKAPELLPFYTRNLAYIIQDCTDSIYKDSIYLLQYSLDVLKRRPVDSESVQQYLRINKCFMENRVVNSFNGVIFVKNRLPEIREWYIKNRDYVVAQHNKDYRNLLLEYDIEYLDNVFLFASSIGAQSNDWEYAISLYEDCISIVKPLLQYDSTLSQKIARCYANIAQNYYLQGDKVKCKEYGDKTIESLIYHREDLEYCDILSVVAINCFLAGSPQLAAGYKFLEIATREDLGWHCSQSEWSLYFMFLLASNQPEIVLKYQGLAINAPYKDGINSSLLLSIGDAYSMLMNKKPEYKDTAEWYFKIVDTLITVKKNNPDKYNYNEEESINLKRSLSNHYNRFGDLSRAYDYCKQLISYYRKDIPYEEYSQLSLLASRLHDIKGIHKYLPLFYYGMESDLLKMLPTLGTIESEIYLGNGEIELYHIPEWTSWNPSDTVSTSVAYDATLLMKGLTLKYNTITYDDTSDSILLKKHKIDLMRDSLYTINDNTQMMLALYRYEQAERELLNEINRKAVSIHWQDIKKQLNENNVCIEFVRYTANAYSWSNLEPKLHYAAIVLSDVEEYPIFIDLLDEDELLDMYKLQPKSYDTEVGFTLYEKLWGKLDKYITGKSRVYFSPMGMLNLINIEALADSNGVTALEKYNLARVSSTRQIVCSKEDSPIQSVVSYGGIDYTEMAEAIVDSLNTRGNWNYLKNTLTEVRNVEASLQKNNIKVNTIIGSNATEASFKALDGTTANVIHIASHGFYIPMQQWDAIPYYRNSEYTQTIKDELFYSGLVMSGGQSAWIDSTFKAEVDDGILTSYEISKLDLHNVDLVVLSACETGLGCDFFDGIFGMQRAFKKAGVRSILMSLWNINDRATSEYMELFYNFLTSGLSKQESYRRTVSEMRNRYQDANYWASFVLLD